MSRFTIARLGVLVVLLAAAGCGGPSQAQINDAKAAVAECLEVWKKGGKLADLKSLSRPVDFQDGTWHQGDTLVSYDLTRASYNARDKVIRCDAKLTLKSRRGKPRTEEVAYDVTLGNPMKVTLNPMP